MARSGPDGARAAFEAFLRTPLGETLDAHAAADADAAALAHFASVAREVPAYASLLAEHGVDPRSVTSIDAFRRLPLLTKESYVRRWPLAARCRGGDLLTCDTVAFSSGSTGDATLWPRALSHELEVTARFEQILVDAFRLAERRTLAVVCFPLGTWVGGMFTSACCRHLAAKGYPLFTVTPGNVKPEILRVVRALAPSFEQTVLLGYPPFLKDVVDTGLAAGVPWHEHAVKLVLAGEVVTEEWRALVAERAAIRSPIVDVASMYGTADAGALGVETPVAAAIREAVAARPEDARALFGKARLPTLCQYDPIERYFEVTGEGTLAFSGENGAPLVRYDIADDGGLYPFAELVERVRALGVDPIARAKEAGAKVVRELPFVYVFGRSHHVVSIYGANVFPEMVSAGLETPGVARWVTGKFVMQARETADRDRELHVVVELAAGVDARAASDMAVAALVAGSVRDALARLDSEYAAYVPAARQTPTVELRAHADPAWFPAGVKHRYTR